MNISFLVLGGYGLYVWPAFIITLGICLYFYLITRAELKLQEKNYLIEFKHFENKKVKAFKEKESLKVPVAVN
tara:strand:- start:380 stop:598 length:219 start_codon:yes stop_codon:yes gene_type:complete